LAGRIGVDFGTSNTVICVWDQRAQEGVPLHIPHLVRPYDFRGEPVAVVPSVITYAEDGRTWIGDQVLGQGLEDSPRTFRWMKRYISARSPRRRHLGDRDISDAEAGKDFLVTLLEVALAQTGAVGEEVVYTLPVESFEHYEDWVARVSDQVGLPRYRMIDEASAAALGYGVHVQEGDVYLVFDFGGGTLDVSVVLIEEEDGVASGKQHCRVLGKAGSELGGASIDAWLYQRLLAVEGIRPEDQRLTRLGRQLLLACEQAKIRLSSADETEVHVDDPDSGATLGGRVTRGDLDDLLDENDAFHIIHDTIQRALSASIEKGYDDDHIKAVLVVGGCGLIPSVTSLLRQRFGRRRVQVGRPLDAVARGAAAFASGVGFYDHIQHSYAIRHVDPKSGQEEFVPLLSAGTPYPTPRPIKTLTVKATYDGQTHLGIDIYELGYERQATPHAGVELAFDPKGAVRLTEVSHRESERRARFWINEGQRTFLEVADGARAGEPRFKVSFGVDGNKRLTITAHDLVTGDMPLREYPVVKLT
jgi:molecular chaperone DnaK (HSP70)